MLSPAIQAIHGDSFAGRIPSTAGVLFESTLTNIATGLPSIFARFRAGCRGLKTVSDEGNHSGCLMGGCIDVILDFKKESASFNGVSPTGCQCCGENNGLILSEEYDSRSQGSLSYMSCIETQVWRLYRKEASLRWSCYNSAARTHANSVWNLTSVFQS